MIRDATKEVANEYEDALKRIKKPIYDEELQNHLIITGLPQIKNEEQFKKLGTAVKGLINEKKKIPGLQDVEVEWDGKVGNGTAYVVFDNVKNAKTALHKLNQTKFTKTDVLSCFTVKEVQDVLNFKSEFKEPEFISTKEKLEQNLDSNGFDQFVFREVRKSDPEEGSKIYLKWFNNYEKKTTDVM